MNFWVLVLFAGLGVRVGYLRWSRSRWPTFLLGLVLTGLLVSGAMEATFRWQEHTYSKVASDLSGRDAAVHCQRFSGAMINVFGPDGFVPFDANGATKDIHLKWEVCHNLLKYKFSGHGNPSEGRIVAVHILTHEAMHVAGHLNEAEAECTALQRNALTAQRLGAEPGEAQALAQAYFTGVYPRLTEGYVSPDCLADAALDEHLTTSPWRTTP